MQYFDIDEFTHSDTAKRLGISNTPSLPETINIATLVNEVLDPLRRIYGKPIYVNSGYRCELLNAAVGGSPTSKHMEGLAADITAGSRAGNKALATILRSSDLPFDQLILYNKTRKGPTHLHIGLASEGHRNRYQVLER